MQSLDTNTWSLIIFVTQLLMMFCVLILFSRPLIKAAILTAVFWLILQTIFSLYGYYTDQLGFLLMGISNILISIVASIMKVGEDKNNYEDN